MLAFNDVDLYSEFRKFESEDTAFANILPCVLRIWICEACTQTIIAFIKKKQEKGLGFWLIWYNTKIASVIRRWRCLCAAFLVTYLNIETSYLVQICTYASSYALEIWGHCDLYFSSSSHLGDSNVNGCFEMNCSYYCLFYHWNEEPSSAQRAMLLNLLIASSFVADLHKNRIDFSWTCPSQGISDT